MFTIRPFESRTLSWWYQERSNIDMSPVFQRRGGLWSNKDKQFLIDSIINGYDMPKFYLADFTYVRSKLSSDGKDYAVIDGRQRLEAIFDFFDGKYKLPNDFIYEKDQDLKISGMGYDDIKNAAPKVATSFENFNISVMSVITDDESKINELFVRLNKNKPLSGAEIRNAMKGKIPSLIREISEHRFFKDNVRFSISRGADKNTAAKLLLCEFSGSLVSTKKKDLDNFVEKVIQAENSEVDVFAKRVEEVLDVMSTEFDQNDTALASEGQIPVYYWAFRNHRDDSSNVAKVIKWIDENKSGPASLESTILGEVVANYATLSRSVNDSFSLHGRYKILSNLIKDRYISSLYQQPAR